MAHYAVETTTNFKFSIEANGDPVEVIIHVPVADFPLLEDDLELVESALDQVTQLAAETSISRVALVFARDPARWTVSHYVRSSGEIVSGA